MSQHHATTWQRTRDTAYEKLSERKILAFLTVFPALFIFLAVNVIPIVWAIYASFHEISSFSPVWEWNGLGNYWTILGDPVFWDAMMKSLVFAGGSVVLQLVAGISLALLVNRSFKFGNIIRGIALFPYLVPTVFIGFISTWMFNGSFGVANQILLQLGLIDSYISWFGSISLAMPALIVVNSWKFTVFVTLLVLARLQSIPAGYYEAAQIAGATKYQQFRDITLPNIKGVIFIVLLLRGVFMFNKFDIIWVLTRGGPVDATTTAPIYAYQKAFAGYSLGQSITTAVILFIMLVIAAIIYFKMFEPEQEVRVE